MTQNNKHIRIFFIQVKTDEMKRKKITELSMEYFEKKSPLLFKVPHQKAVDYLDLLLWRYPQDSFLPHSVENTHLKELITITTSKENPNEAKSLFNLTAKPIDNTNLFFTHIYEFEDLSSTARNKNAQDRYKIYKEQGFSIITV